MKGVLIKRSFMFSSEDNISHELKTGGNGYVDIKEIPELWGKDLKYREKQNHPQRRGWPWDV